MDRAAQMDRAARALRRAHPRPRVRVVRYRRLRPGAWLAVVEGLRGALVVRREGRSFCATWTAPDGGSGVETRWSRRHYAALAAARAALAHVPPPAPARDLRAVAAVCRALSARRRPRPLRPLDPARRRVEPWIVTR